MSNIDHEYTIKITCPYCGNEQSDSWEFSENGEITCDVCENDFEYEKIVTVQWSTNKKPCSEHNYILREGNEKFIYDSIAVFYPKYHRQPLAQSEWKYFKLVKCTICDKEDRIEVSINEYNLITKL